MPVLILMVCFLPQDFRAPWLDLEKLEVFDPVFLTLTRHEDATYIVSFSDNLIVKVDDQGSLLARYAAAGQGPLELHMPGLLGVTARGVYVVTRLNTVICLNHDLNPTGETMPMLPFRINSGVALEPNRFLVTGRLAPEPAALVDLQLKNGSWDTSRSIAPLHPTPGRPLFPSYDNGVLFVFHGLLRGYEDRPTRDIYDINTFRYGAHGREEGLRQIRGDVHDAVPKADMLMLTYVVAWEGGYAVVLKHSHKRKFVQSMLDLYDSEGHFLKRQSFENEIRIFPIQGALNDLLIDVVEATAYRLGDVVKPME